MRGFMRKMLLVSGAVVLALVTVAPVAAQPTCTDISDQCLTTLPEDCTDAIGSEVTIQIGGQGAEDSNGDGGTCVNTKATALLTFEKIDADTYDVTVDNTEAGASGAWTSSTAGSGYLGSDHLEHARVIPTPPAGGVSVQL